MREVGNEKRPENIKRRNKRRRIKYPGRFTVFVVTAIICIWMIYTFILALASGQKFSMLGVSSEPVRTFVVAGIDEGGYRTDLIMLCQTNRYTNETNIIQIPRDTRVENNRNDKKINSAYYSGFECMSSEIYKVTGLKPDHYIMVDFEGFSDIIDALGGVTVDVPIRMNYTDPVQDLVIDLKPGKQRLNGEETQMFMRFRQNNDGTGYANGDMDRIEAQKSVYSAVTKKLMSPIGIIRAPFVFGAVALNTDTDMNLFELAGTLKDVAATVPNINVHTLPGEGRYIGGGSYYVPYKNQTQELVSENFVR